MRIECIYNIEVEIEQFEEMLDAIDMNLYSFGYCTITNEDDEQVIKLTITNKELDDLLEEIGEYLIDENTLRGTEHYRTLRKFYCVLQESLKWL